MTLSLRVTFPLPPNMANGRGHWRKRLREKADYETEAKRRARLWEFSAPWSFKPLLARVEATLYLHSVMDTDNCFARLKWPLDLLVRWGYLVDDKPAHCELAMPRQVIERDRAKQRIEFVITPITPAEK